MLDKIISAISDRIGRLIRSIGSSIIYLVKYALSPRGQINRKKAQLRQKMYRMQGHSRTTAMLLSILHDIEEGRLKRHNGNNRNG